LQLVTNTRKLNLYAPCGSEARQSACHYYRTHTPFQTMRRLGLAKFTLDNLAPKPDGEREHDLAYADIHQYYLNIAPAVLQRINYFKQWKMLPDETGLRRLPPHMIFDADDSIQHVDVFNPKYVTLGTHLPDGTKLEPGAQIHAETADGQEVLVWEDGRTYPDGTLDVAANLRKLRLYKMIIRNAHGCTVSNERLANVYRGYGAKNVYVYPNCLSRLDYPEIRVRRPTDHVRILWQGGYSHFIDWNPLRDSLARVFRARPKARLVVWGMLFPGVHKAVPEKQLEFIDWDIYARFTFRLATIGHHINLAPLARNTFNDCKTPIKWLESSAITTPAATLASAGPVYGDEAITHGETGLLYNTPQEFEDYLIALIDDASLRNRLAKRAQEDVWDRYEAEPHVRKLYRFYMDMREREEREPPGIPQF